MRSVIELIHADSCVSAEDLLVTCDVIIPSQHQPPQLEGTLSKFNFADSTWPIIYFATMFGETFPSHDSPTPSKELTDLFALNNTYTEGVETKMEKTVKAEEESVKLEEESVKVEEESVKVEEESVKAEEERVKVEESVKSEYDDDEEEETDNSEDEEQSEYVPDHDEEAYSDDEKLMKEKMLRGDYEVIRQFST
ncbi:hypothetical protein BD410DRAFT_388712 [Rickenella mellea]|uniref:Uncharacterized protein n=1 Tax=Rickenella mellea TaxID=50990 RepID=A0A4Y7PXY8_9AGAM|nr:hypothetical protein BD410DRAFT_388712 [Rickenella mellea]